LSSSKTFLDSFITDNSHSKYGKRYSSRNTKFSHAARAAATSRFERDSTKKRKFYVGQVLRVEIQSEAGEGWPFEPGSLPTKKYRGHGAPPEIVAIKVRIPEIHSMLPIPRKFGSDKCDSNGAFDKCHHPIIDLYPTFYGETNQLPVPDPGELVRVTYRNFEAATDPIYIGSEAKWSSVIAGRGLSGAGAFSSLGAPPGRVVVPAATCGHFPPVPVLSGGNKDKLYGSACRGFRKVRVPFRGKTIGVNEAAAAAFRMVEADLTKCPEAQGYNFFKGKTKRQDGVGACRCMQHKGTWPNCEIGVSNHSWAIAIDINPADNPACYGPKSKNPKCKGQTVMIYDIPECVIAAFKRYGFVWGGEWKNYIDTMHFEFKGDPRAAEQALSQRGSYNGNPYCRGRPTPGNPGGSKRKSATLKDTAKKLMDLF